MVCKVHQIKKRSRIRKDILITGLLRIEHFTLDEDKILYVLRQFFDELMT